MSDYAWFKLFVRGIGLILIGLAISDIPSWIGWFVYALTQDGFEVAEFIYRFFPGFVGPALQLAFGLYLFFGAKRLIARCLRDVRGHCASCGYDISSITSDKCPECGAGIRPISSPPSGPSH